MIYDVLIIGAGVTGSFIARELAKYKLNVIVLDKDSDCGSETSSANSAIVHSGYDPEPGSLKAILNVAGNAMYDKVCDELDVSFKRIGSLTLAISDEDLPALKKLQERATLNGVETKLLSKEETKAIEPNVADNVCGSLLAPSAGIINPFTLVTHLIENAMDNGVKLVLNEKVSKIIKENGIFTINDKYQAKVVINAAGYYSDKINELINPKTFEIIPRKGEYYVLDHFKGSFVNHTLFMLPSNKGKGVLVSPTTSGNYLVGPSAEVVELEDKSTDKDTMNNIKAQANLMVANIPYYQTIRSFAGIRPTPSNHDFIIKESETENFINVAGIESPGLASAPAIAKKVIDEIISKKFKLEVKENYNPRVRKYIKTKELSIEERNELFKKDPSYGRIVCKCEQVTEGEIKDCLSRNNPPRTIEGLKRRLRVGFGKCQGGMCQSIAIGLIANHFGIDKKDVMYDNGNSYILMCHTKEEN